MHNRANNLPGQIRSRPVPLVNRYLRLISWNTEIYCQNKQALRAR